MLTRTEQEFIKSLGPEGERIWADIAHWVVAHRMEKSDRSVAIVGASMLESALESALERALIEHSVTRGLFGRQGSLATFAAKADMAFAMGILSEWEWRDLDRIRRVRNHFAHELRARSFAGSGPCRSRIPEQADHRFRSKAITDSGASRSLNA